MPDNVVASTTAGTHAITIPEGMWVLAIAIALIAGLFGGVGSALQEEMHRARLGRFSIFSTAKNRAMLWEFILGRGCVGAVTGLAGLFPILMSPIASSFSGGAFWAFLAGASTIFGVFASSLLPAMGLGFRKRLGIIEEEITDVQSKVDVNTAQDKAERALDDAFTSGALRSDIEKQIKIVIEYLSSFPRSRRINIRHGRVLFEKLKDRMAAHNAMSRFIEFLEKLPVADRDPEFEKDLADALYNRSCYQLASPGKEELLDEAYVPTPEAIAAGVSDLDRSIKLWPPNKEDAKEDVYFKWARAHSAELIALLS
jgi:hypothetical protein